MYIQKKVNDNKKVVWETSIIIDIECQYCKQSCSNVYNNIFPNNLFWLEKSL